MHRRACAGRARRSFAPPRPRKHVRGDHLGRPLELRAKLRLLCGDADGTRVAVTRAHHDAALGQERRRPEGVLVGANRAATRTSRPVRKPPSTRTFTRERRPSDTSVCCVSASPISTGAGVLDRRQRRRAGSAVGARDHDDSARPLATPAAIWPTPRRDELHRNVRAGFTCLRSKISCARSRSSRCRDAAAAR